MKKQTGFTLIELMVVIVIIGILSALAIPKMFGVSSKAKAAEAPGVVSNWETLQSAYAQESGTAGGNDLIGFQLPTSNWFTYANGLGPGAMAATAQFTATVQAAMAFGDCVGGEQWISDYDAAMDNAVRSEMGACPATYTPNFVIP